VNFLEPLIAYDAITRDECNDALRRWAHRMGPVERPDTGVARFHGLRHDGRLIAVTASDALIAETCAGFTRAQAYELSRVCAERADLNRVTVRLWREFVFPAMAQVRGYSWAVSYQDAVLHSGNLYRFDGWIELGRSASGTDQRSGRKGRRKVIWGWHPDPATRRAHTAAERSLPALGSIKDAWTRETSHWPDRWSKENPAVGQCAVTALAVQSLLGGVIERLLLDDGDTHYRNVIGGQVVDLTASQWPGGVPIISGYGLAPLRGELERDPDLRRRYGLLMGRLRRVAT
jgi:antitoxin VapB